VTARREGLIIDLVVEPGIPNGKVLARVPVQAVVDGDGVRSLSRGCATI